MTKPLSVQMHAIREPLTQNFEGAFARVAQLGYDAVELTLHTGTPESVSAQHNDRLREIMGEGFTFTPGPPKELLTGANIKRILEDNGLTVSGCHVYLPDGDSGEEILDEQELLGNKYLIANAGFDAPENPEEAKRLAERYNVAAERARKRGMRIGYHNHFTEVAPHFDGKSGIELFFDLLEPDVFAEIDIYWSYIGGRKPEELIQTLGSRVQMIHLKDGQGVFGDVSTGPGKPSTALGQGKIAVAESLDAAKHAVCWTVELERLAGEEVFSALAESRQFLLDYAAKNDTAATHIQAGARQ